MTEKTGDPQSERNAEFFRPLDNTELPKIREQVRDTINKRYLLATERFSDYAHRERFGALSNSKDYGSNYVRTLFLLNGGALIALLTFIGGMFGKNDQTILLIAISFTKSVLPAFYAFATGLVLIALVSAIAYFNWAWVAHSWPEPADLHRFIIALPGSEVPPSLDVKITASLYLAVVFAFLSLGCFVFELLVWPAPSLP